MFLLANNLLLNFTFSVPSIIIQLLQLKQINAQNVIKFTIMLYMTGPSQGTHNCTVFFNIFCSLMMGQWDPKHVAAGVL
jgi:hypothetical protein